MKTSRTDEIIREIALRHGTSCEAVKAALESAIDRGRASTDPHSQFFWNSIYPEGSDIVLEDLLQSLAFLSAARLVQQSRKSIKAASGCAG